MALSDPYAELAELRLRLRDEAGNISDAELTNALLGVSRGIEKICHRQFNKATSATARVYGTTADNITLGILHKSLAFVDDFWTTTGLVIKTDLDDDGTFETTWATSDRQLEPLNGIVDGELGWPYWRIKAVDSQRFPINLRRAPLEVTAQWGWENVPANIKEACLVVSAETASLRDAQFGVASTAEWGVIRVRANPMAMAMIRDYRRDAVLVA